jgi:hypothetical protein
MNYRSTTGSTFSRQVTGDTTNLPEIQYCVRMQRDSGNTSTIPIFSAHSLESSMSRQFAGKTITLSWYARAGANFSATSSQMGVYIFSGTGTDQNTIAGFTGQTVVSNETKTITTTWQRFSVTASVPATATQLGVQLFFTPTGTAGAADYFDITGVQLEAGSVATPFKRNAPSIQAELAACQRYYQRVTATNLGNFLSPTGMAYSATNAFISFPLKTTMRAPATSVDYASLRLYDGVNAASAVTNLIITTTDVDETTLLLTVASGLTIYRPYKLLGNTLPSYVGISAEL